jgi:hypothetical protein
MTTSTLRAALAPRIVPVLLANLTTRFPYHDSHLMREGESPIDPTTAHPAFCNSYDWHSSVHSHWTALQVSEYLETESKAATDGITRLREAIETNLTPAHLAAESEYLATHPSYERPYGWAWALALAALSKISTSRRTRILREPLNALAEVIANNALCWLAVLPEPVRHGIHGNTAFALGLMYDAANVLELHDLERVVVERSGDWFLRDRGWPLQWERSGSDFLSAGLAEADLVRRILTPGKFGAWWNGFLPVASSDEPAFVPVTVPDVVDGHIVHLHGLNLSRAGMLAQIASVLRSADESEERIAILLSQAESLYRAGLEHAITGDYLSTHWLPTYAWIAAGALDGALR